MFTILTYYRAFYKEAINNFFWRAIKKSHEDLKKIFQSHVSDLDQKKERFKFPYCYTGLGAGWYTKEAIISFVEHFKEKQENTLCIYFAVVIYGKTHTTW